MSKNKHFDSAEGFNFKAVLSWTRVLRFDQIQAPDVVDDEVLVARLADGTYLPSPDLFKLKRSFLFEDLFPRKLPFLCKSSLECRGPIVVGASIC